LEEGGEEGEGLCGLAVSERARSEGRVGVGQKRREETRGRGERETDRDVLRGVPRARLGLGRSVGRL